MSNSNIDRCGVPGRGSLEPHSYSALWLDFYRSPLIVTIWLVFVLTHAMFLGLYYLAPDLLRVLTVEDGLMENASALMYLVAAVCFALGFSQCTHRLDRFWVITFAATFIFMAGEELSWGQRILDYRVDAVEEINVQDEFNVHNLPWFHQQSFSSATIMSIGTLLFGVVMPIVLSLSKSFRRLLINVLRFPVPHPVVGVCFLLSYAWYRGYHPTAPIPISIEESRETTIALGLLVYALLLPRMKNAENQTG